MPHFMAYPSTTTVIAAIILFLNGIIRLNYHNRNDAMLRLSIVNMVIAIIKSIRCTRFFASLQERAPNIIWSKSVLSALSHPIFRWAFPDFNATLVRSVHSMCEGFKRGGQPEEPREVAEFGVGVDEDTPLMGRGFSRMNSRVMWKFQGIVRKGL